MSSEVKNKSVGNDKSPKGAVGNSEREITGSGLGGLTHDLQLALAYLDTFFAVAPELPPQSRKILFQLHNHLRQSLGILPPDFASNQEVL